MCSPAALQAWRSSLRLLTERRSVSATHAVPTSCNFTRPRANRIRSIRLVRHVAYNAHQPTTDLVEPSEKFVRKEIQNRKHELDQSAIEQYPRVDASSQSTCSLRSFTSRYNYLEKDQTEDTHGTIIVSGRISSIRKNGSKLAFVDITEEPGHHRLQILLNLNHLSSVERSDFANHIRLIRRGDVISAKGFPTRSNSGQLSLLASELTTLLSPCLHTVPQGKMQAELSPESDLLEKHVEMLANPSIIQTLVARSKLIQTMRSFFEAREFCEVQTPILAAAAGGATARPFETTSSDLPDKRLALRIAPELWLKRLILGGMPKVFEIGPSFRNEGQDNTHNPEFTTCEFYAVGHSLSQLQRMTEELLRIISVQLGEAVPDQIPHALVVGNSSGHFAEIDFIPALNAHLSQPLPNLSTPTARSEVLDLFVSHSIPVPAVPTLPRLLDKLCSHFLEPHCVAPTWIINTPECLSPLAKSFIHPTAPNSQPVAARAELFIDQKEIVNCYEEENSPFEQRRKLIEQQMYARSYAGDKSSKAATSVECKDSEAMKVDEAYLQALEWGLPPTGGWGCGIDRLVMLFTGKSRISEVLAFGNLRALARTVERAQK